MARSTWVGVSLLVFAAATFWLMWGRLAGLYAGYRGQLGIGFWLLMPQAALVATGLLRALLKDPMGGGIGSRMDLAFIESAGPGAGLVCSVIGMRDGLGALELSATGNMSGAMAQIIGTVATALSATAWGLALGLVAWFVGHRLAPPEEGAAQS